MRHLSKSDRADGKVKQNWANGVHTSAVGRKLVTGSTLDLQCNDLSARRPLFHFPGEARA
jgi:hypothetical protein